MESLLDTAKEVWKLKDDAEVMLQMIVLEYLGNGIINGRIYSQFTGTIVLNEQFHH